MLFYKNSEYWASFISSVIKNSRLFLTIDEEKIRQASCYLVETIVNVYGYMPVDILASYWASVFESNDNLAIFESFLFFKDFIHECAHYWQFKSKSLTPLKNYLNKMNFNLYKTERYLPEKVKHGVKFLILHFSQI